MSTPQLGRSRRSVIEESLSPALRQLQTDLALVLDAAFETVEQARLDGRAGSEEALRSFLEDESTTVVSIEAVAKKLGCGKTLARELIDAGELERVEIGSPGSKNPRIGTTAKSLRELVERRTKPSRKKAS
jgi:hypothetical protein